MQINTPTIAWKHLKKEHLTELPFKSMQYHVSTILNKDTMVKE